MNSSPLLLQSLDWLAASQIAVAAPQGVALEGKWGGLASRRQVRKNWHPKLYVMTMMLVLSLMLLSCDEGNGSSHAALVPFDRLVANPEHYAGEYVCTKGVHIDGFEISGLGAATYQEDGYPRLAEPVIWLERADMQSREDCIQTNTTPLFELCQAVVCGIFETGGGYGHGGGYAYQLQGCGLSALPITALAAAGPIQVVVSPIL